MQKYMDLTFTGLQIQELLISNETFTIPRAGRLIICSRPASFLEDGKTIVPPKKVLLFEQECSEGFSAQMESCAAWQEELSGIMMEALSRNGVFEIPGIGKFSDNGAGEIRFAADEDFNFSPDNFSLESISLEIAVPEQEAATSPDQIQMEEPAQETTQETAQEPATELAQEPAEEVTEGIGPVQIPAMEPAAEPQPAKVTDLRGHDVTAKRNARNRWLLWILVIVVALAVLVLFVILFKEDLRPLLEKLLYTKEELEIMQKWAAR